MVTVIARPQPLERAGRAEPSATSLSTAIVSQPPGPTEARSLKLRYFKTTRLPCTQGSYTRTARTFDTVATACQIRTMPVTEVGHAHVEAYRSDGYLLLPGMFGEADLEPVRVAIEDEVDRLADRFYREGKVSSRFADQPFNRRLVQLCESAGEEVRIWELRTRASVTPELYQFVRHPRMLEVMTALLGPEVALDGELRGPGQAARDRGNPVSLAPGHPVLRQPYAAPARDLRVDSASGRG